MRLTTKLTDRALKALTGAIVVGIHDGVIYTRKPGRSEVSAVYPDGIVDEFIFYSLDVATADGLDQAIYFWHVENWANPPFDSHEDAMEAAAAYDERLRRY